jgi:hypothetical protein
MTLVPKPAFDWKLYLSILLGAAVGVFAFLIAAVLVLGDPAGDWFISAHAVLVGEKQRDLSLDDQARLYHYMIEGVIVPTDGLISQIANFYGSIIQVLIGLFFVFGLVSFFVLRWHSKQFLDEAVGNAVETALKNHTNSINFDNMITLKVQNVASTEIEGLEQSISAVGDFDDRLSVVEDFISNSDHSEESLPEIAEANPIAKTVTKRRPPRKTKES